MFRYVPKLNKCSRNSFENIVQVDPEVIFIVKKLENPTLLPWERKKTQGRQKDEESIVQIVNILNVIDHFIYLYMQFDRIKFISVSGYKDMNK